MVNDIRVQLSNRTSYHIVFVVLMTRDNHGAFAMTMLLPHRAVEQLADLLAPDRVSGGCKEAVSHLSILM